MFLQLEGLQLRLSTTMLCVFQKIKCNAIDLLEDADLPTPTIRLLHLTMRLPTMSACSSATTTPSQEIVLEHLRTSKVSVTGLLFPLLTV